MATPKTITAFKYRTEVIADITKHTSEFKKADETVEKYGKTIQKVAKDTSKAFDGAAVGQKFGQQFSASATSLITGSFDSLGATLGGIIGTAMAPGIGTAIGSTIGSAADAVFSKVSGAVMKVVYAGIELNKELERTKVEFTTFAGSEKEAVEYLDQLKKLAIDTGTDFKWVLETSESVFDLTDNLKLTNTILRASVDAAADFGGKPETIRAIADALGLIAEKGDLSGKSLQKLFKLKINAPELLAQATGMSVSQIKKLIAQDRLRGDVAARLIAEGIERNKAGFAKKIADTTTYGAESRFAVLTQLRGAEGTEEATRGIGDFYRKGNELLSSEKAKEFVSFINQTTGSLINLVEKGLGAGVQITKGLADGIVSGDAFRAVGSATTSLGNYVEESLKSVFAIESPSQRMVEKIGIPLGMGIGVGTRQGMLEYGALHANDDVKDFIRLYEEAAREAQRRTGVPASVSMAQAILESGAGKSGLTRRAKNFFGIKGRGPAGSVNMRTREETRSGQSYYVNAPFRAYNTADESFLDHAKFLQGPRYRGALPLAGDPKAYARSIASSGYATDRNYAGKLGGLIDKYNLTQLDVGGSAVSASNPVPVYLVAGVTSGAGGIGAPPGVRDSLGGAAMMFGQGQQAQNLKEYTLVLDDADGAVVDLKVEMNDLVTSGLMPGTRQFRELINSVEPATRAITPLIGAEKEHAATSIALTKEYQQAARDELVKGMSMLDQLSGAIGQIAGMMPQQTVGKKRGLFSKILGFAAPFLSFIPGVGPILSQIAGIASNAVAGNWAGVATGVAGGFASGGVFRSSGGGSGGSSGGGAATGDRGAGLPPRAAGGPGYRGRTYWVGEHGPEPFMAPSNGYFLNHRDAMHALGSNGGGGGDSGMAAMLERLHGVLARLEGIRPHDMVRMGARGFTQAMTQDASLIRLTGQRLRLS